MSDRRTGLADRRGLRRRVIGLVAVGYCVLSLGLIAAVAKIDHDQVERLREQAARDAWARHDIAYAQCERVQALRSEVNDVIRSVRGLATSRRDVSALDLMPRVHCAEVVPHPIVPRPGGGVVTTTTRRTP